MTMDHRRELTFRAAAIALLALSASAWALDPAECEREHERAEGLLFSGEPEAARQAFQKLLGKKTCRSIDSYLGLAAAHFRVARSLDAESKDRRRIHRDAYQALLDAGRKATDGPLDLDHYRAALKESRQQVRSLHGEAQDLARFRACALRPFAGEEPEEHAYDPSQGDAEEVEVPRVLYSPPLGYTDLTRRRRVQGVVIGRLRIDEYGCVTHVQIVKSLHQHLDRVSVEALRRHVFVAGSIAARPVPFLQNRALTFRLE